MIQHDRERAAQPFSASRVAASLQSLPLVRLALGARPASRGRTAKAAGENVPSDPPGRTELNRRVLQTSRDRQNR